MTRSIVGSGENTYEVVDPFGRAPDGIEIGAVSDIAVDSMDRVYFYQRRENPVLVFDSEGNFLTTWGKGVIADPHGIYISPQDEIFVTDKNAHEVLKFDLDGNLLLRLGNRERPSFQEPFNHPADVAVSPSGEIYVADGYGNSRIHRYTSEGEHIQSWGVPGKGPGEFTVPHGIWVDRRSRVFVCDRENGRVQIFDADGGFVAQWTDFFNPMDIYVDADDKVYVTDQVPRLSVYRMEGTLIARCFLRGHGLWGDSRGNLYSAWPYDPAPIKLAKQSSGP